MLVTAHSFTPAMSKGLSTVAHLSGLLLMV